MLENVVGGPGERCRAAVGVYRAGHFFYSRFINYRSVVIKLDAAFEAALGCALLAGGFGPADFPHPVGRVVVVVVAVVLLVAAGVLWRGRIALRDLAAANLATAAAAAVWLAAADGFSSAGKAIVAVTAAGLAGLATAQIATLRA